MSLKRVPTLRRVRISLFKGQKALTAEENFVLARKVSEGDLVARDRMIRGNAGFAYSKALKYVYKSAGLLKLDEQDIIQAALLGLCEAVDRYDLNKKNKKTGRPYAFTTYAAWWILKMVNEEISRTHWTTCRPPRAELRLFLYGGFTTEQMTDYISMYVRQHGMDGERVIQHREDAEYGWSEISQIVDQAELSSEEQRVFDSLYGENPEEDDLSDLSKSDLIELEFSILHKIKEQL